MDERSNRIKISTQNVYDDSSFDRTIKRDFGDAAMAGGSFACLINK